MSDVDHTADIFQALGELKGTTTAILRELKFTHEAHLQNSTDIDAHGTALGVMGTRLASLEETVDELSGRRIVRLRDGVTVFGMVAGPVFTVMLYVASRLWG